MLHPSKPQEHRAVVRRPARPAIDGAWRSHTQGTCPSHPAAPGFSLRASSPLRFASLCQPPAEALEQLPDWQPEVVLLDLDLGSGRDGLEILPGLARQLPGAKFLILTVLDDPVPIYQAAQRGASGYLRKSIPLAELPAAIQEVHEGFPRFTREVLRLIWQSFRNPPADAEERSKLSPREAEVLDLLAQGYDRADVAQRLNIGKETVKAHVRNILGKLEVRSWQHAVQKVYPRKRFWLLPRRVKGGGEPV